MEKTKKLLEVFGDYLSANTYYEIYWSRLHQQYFAMSVEDEPAVFFENYEDLRRYCKQSSKIQKFSPENAEFFGVNFLL